MPEPSIRELLERATERIDDRSTRMLVRGNLAAALARLAEAVEHAQAILDRHDEYDYCADDAKLTLCPDRKAAEALVGILGAERAD